MTKTISRGLVLVASLFGATGNADPDSRLPEIIAPADLRLLRIQQYFVERDCPAHVYARDFVLASDWHGLDWRLLPSLSMVESGGGKEIYNNNMFGWANAQVRFESPRAGIYKVAARLRQSKLYKNKNLEQVLWTYNPKPDYVNKVKMVMKQLGPKDLAPTASF